MAKAPIRTLPSAEFLNNILDYNPSTGDLVWKPRESANFNAKYAGKKAGSVSIGRDGGDNKYLVVGIRYEGKYQQYPAHRIIWKMVTGQEPPEMVDHRDGDNFNNRWLNFRSADNGRNLQNAKLRRDNKSGVKGICWDHARRKWLAQIGCNKQLIRIGRFSSLEAAGAAIAKKRIELHGEFARLK